MIVGSIAIAASMEIEFLIASNHTVFCSLGAAQVRMKQNFERPSP